MNFDAAGPARPVGTIGNAVRSNRMSEGVIIRTARDYRQAIVEVQHLESAQADSVEFRRRHELLAAMHQYELKHLGADFKPGKPAPFSVQKP